jgi:hypothetical protein
MPAALTQQPTMTIPRRSWKFDPWVLHAIIFPDSELCFRRGSARNISNPRASDRQHGQGGSICAPANVLRVSEIQIQDNRLLLFGRQYLISTAKAA